MPGHKPLPDHVTGSEADAIRVADAMQRAGDAPGAARELESALELELIRSSVMPWQLTARLAALYRMLHRGEDEVRLLMRFQESHVDEELQARLQARLSKARAIAERQATSAASSALTTMRAHRGASLR